MFRLTVMLHSCARNPITGTSGTHNPIHDLNFFASSRLPWRIAAFTRECDFGHATFSSNDRAVYPCPRSNEFGHPAGDDRPGYLAVPGRLGLHSANGSLKDSTCPPVNKNGCYRLSWRVIRLR